MNVGLFVSCLVDNARPAIGFASLELLEAAGCTVTVPPQTCCGQPAYNNGNRCEAIDIAKATISAFEGLAHIIVPSASCAGMIKYHYPALFEEGSEWQKKAKDLAAKCHELTSFLSEIAPLDISEAAYEGRIYYHESCSARREMKCKNALNLLNKIEGAEVMDLPHNEACCGFGGLFSVKFDEISNAMVSQKISSLKNQKNAILTGLDLGCLLNIAGKLENEGHEIRVYHIAEVLTGRMDQPLP